MVVGGCVQITLSIPAGLIIIIIIKVILFFFSSPKFYPTTVHQLLENLVYQASWYWSNCCSKITKY